MVLGGDSDIGGILGVEGDTVAITSNDGFGIICFGGDNKIFFCNGGGGVEDGVYAFSGKGDDVVGGAIENPL